MAMGQLQIPWHEQEPVPWWKRFRSWEIQSQAEGSPEPESWRESQTGMMRHGLAFVLRCVSVKSILIFLRLVRHSGNVFCLPKGPIRAASSDSVANLPADEVGREQYLLPLMSLQLREVSEHFSERHIFCVGSILWAANRWERKSGDMQFTNFRRANSGSRFDSARAPGSFRGLGFAGRATSLTSGIGPLFGCTKRMRNSNDRIFIKYRFQAFAE
jgi:hypothetical protein